jgi:hypothetical protein
LRAISLAKERAGVILNVRPSILDLFEGIEDELLEKAEICLD